LRAKNETYAQISLLQLDGVNELVSETSSHPLEWLLDGFATIIDSDFVANSIGLKKSAEQESATKVAELLDVCQKSPTLLNDTELKQKIKDLSDKKQSTEYKDALARALTFLIEPPEGKAAEIYSRLFYAFLADGLVLLIGYSLRRKKTSIYLAKNRRDLTNEEPRLIQEVLYNLAARKPELRLSNGKIVKSYTVENLIYFLNDFFSYFSVESYVKDTKLNVMFSLVSKNVVMLDKNYKELINLLQALNFIKPLSKEQYGFLTHYNRHKAILRREEIEEQLSKISKQSTENREYYYLMTTGCTLYFSEIINDLFAHIENDQIFEELKGKARSLGLIDDDDQNGGN